MSIGGGEGRTWNSEKDEVEEAVERRNEGGNGFFGRCSSRGWIRYVEMNEKGYALYELTASGRMRLEERLANRRLAGILSIVWD